MNDDKSLNQAEPSKEPSDYYLTAPVEIPTQEQMKVKLVPSHLLTRLEETRSDENHWNAVAWAFVGAILGFITDLLVSGQTIFDINPAVVVVMAIFVVGALLAFRTTRRYRSRAELAREEMMGIGLKTETQLPSAEPAIDEG